MRESQHDQNSTEANGPTITNTYSSHNNVKNGKESDKVPGEFIFRLAFANTNTTIKHTNNKLIQIKFKTKN